MPLEVPNRHVRFLCVTLLVAIAVPTASSNAQLTESDRERLADKLRAAGEGLDAERLPELDSAQQDVLGDMKAVREFLSGATDPANFDAWMNYLHLQPLREAIEEDQSPLGQGREAVDLQQRLTGVAPGLELAALRKLRGSVGQLITAIRFRDADQSITAIGNQLESLADRVSQLDRIPAAEDAAAISTVIDVLEHSGQAGEAIDALRQVFSRPNLVLWASEGLIQQIGRREVNQTQQVRNCILGTRLVGVASLQGLVTADLLPSRGTAQIQLTLVADFSSNNTGYNGPVRLKTSGFGQVTASRALHLDQSGGRTDSAHVWASLRTQINSIQHHLGIVRKIAWKKARRQKPLADQIAVEKLQQRVGEQFVSRTNEATAFSPTDLLAESRPYFQRLNLPEPTPYWGSTDQALFIENVLRPSGQLATVVSPPPVTAPSYDAAIQIHESTVRNALAQMLAGRTITDSWLNNVLESIDRAPAADQQPPSESEPPFEFDFARFRPVIFEARDQSVRLGIRATRFQQGGRTLNRPLEITAVYRPQQSDEDVTTLVRDGEVDVDFPGGGRLSLSQTALRSSIKQVFDDLFPSVVLNRTITVPRDAKMEALRGREFRVRWVDAEHGWFSFAIR